MIEGALADLRRGFSGLALPSANGDIQVRTDATPRRLVLRATGLAERQQDEVRTVSGPPVSAGEGAARGFAKKNGVAFEALARTATAKGEYYTLEQKVAGRAVK